MFIIWDKSFTISVKFINYRGHKFNQQFIFMNFTIFKSIWRYILLGIIWWCEMWAYKYVRGNKNKLKLNRVWDSALSRQRMATNYYLGREIYYNMLLFNIFDQKRSTVEAAGWKITSTCVVQRVSHGK